MDHNIVVLAEERNLEVENRATLTPALKEPRSTSTLAIKEPMGMPMIIFAASAGTLFEWYDFFVYGALATTLASQFYQTGTPDGDVIAWVGAFAVGFIVRPIGAILFGYLGDRLGRKYTFLITMLIMGLCTFLIGCLPTQKQIGVSAGYLLILLRAVQGLAIGGEYGGAATYLAEHAPIDKRGLYTGFIQMTPTLSMFLSFVVILAFRIPMGPQFDVYGWRFPFLISLFLVIVSLIIRLKLEESPVFQDHKDSGNISRNPLADSFFKLTNLKYMLIALICTAGQGAIAIFGLFFMVNYVQSILKVPVNESYYFLGVALLVVSPLFLLTAHLSDKYGRKPFMMAGIASCLVLMYPLFILLNYAQPYVDSNAKVLIASPNYNPFVIGFCYFVILCCVALIYGPIAAFLVELFPTSIRYTSVSIPYHIGSGIFGGLVPLIGLAWIKQTGNVYAGLWYPMIVGSISLVLMYLFVPETFHVDLRSIDDSENKTTG